MEKVCCSCKESKELSCFSLKRGKPNAQCKSCKYTQDKEYREKNIEKIRKRSQQYWLATKGTEKQRERNKAKCKNYRQAHPEVGKFHANLRRLRKETATPLWTDKQELLQIYKNCPEGFEVDHIVPLKHPLVCGLHVKENLQYLPKEVNRKKSNSFQL